MTFAAWQKQIHPIAHKLRKRPRPQILVVLLLITGAFPVRLSVGGGLTASLFDLAVCFAVAPLLLILTAKGLVGLPAPFIHLAWVSIALGSLSLFWSQDVGQTVLYIIASGEALLASAMVLAFLRDAPPEQVARLIRGWVMLLLIPAVLLWMRVPGFLPPAQLDPSSGDYISYFVRLSHPFIGRSNNLAALLVLFVVPLAVWAWQKKDRAAGLVAAVASGGVVLTFSRGALVALVAAVALFSLMDSRAVQRLVGRALLLAVPLGLVVAGVITINSATEQFLPDRLTTAGLESRAILLNQAGAALEEHWLQGVGAGTGEDVHNTFIQQILYFGLFGGALAVLLLLRTVWWWFRRGAHGQANWLAQAVGIGVTAQMLSFLVESSYEGSLLRPLLWLSWGLMIAWVRAEAAAGGTDAEEDRNPEPVAPSLTYASPAVIRRRAGSY